jgi:ABC-2 type transport system permease protein
MRIIDLTLKDIKQLLRDWRPALFLLIMPIGFTLMLGFLFGGFNPGGEVDPRLPVGFLDQDDGSYSPYLIALLEDSEVIRLVIDEDASLDRLRKQMGDGDLAGVVVIPEGYGDGLLSGELVKIQVIVEPEAISGTTVQNSVLVAANRLSSAVLAARLSVEAYEHLEAFSAETDRQEYFDSALEKSLAAWENPPIQTKNTQTGAVTVEENDEETMFDNAFIHSSPAMMAQFSIAGLIGAATILVEERKSRSLQRLLTTPISKAEILIGHYLAMFIMIFAQLFILIAFGQLFLKLNYLSHWEATLVLAVATSMCVAGLGLLIGALAKTQEGVIPLSLIPMFVFSGLGGAWVPLEYTGETVQTIGHFTPLAWVMDGFKNILARGQGLESIWLPAVVLLSFALLWFVLAVWRFKFE